MRKKKLIEIHILLFLPILVYLLFNVMVTNVFALEQQKTVIGEHKVRLDYVDEGNHIVCHPSLGYSTIIRTLDEKGRVLMDSYYDENGEPVPAPGGQYGITRNYNDQGQVSEIVCLDKSGGPTLTKYGYGILKRTYDKDGKADTDIYCDLNGNPVALSRGQYGYRRIYQDGKVLKTIYIDENGHDMFFLDLFLLKHPWIVVLSMVILLVMTLIMRQRGRLILFFIYILFILYLTLYIRESSDPHSNLEVFWSYRQMLESGNISSQVVYNIVLFVPLGILTFLLFSRKGWVISFLLSACIEILQYITGTGLCEFDDVFSNTLGGLIGFVLAIHVVKAFPNVRDGWILRRK